MGLTWDDLTDGCCGSEHNDEQQIGPGLLRRNLLIAAGISPFAAAGFTSLATQPAFASPPGVVRAALHIHSSFGEGAGGLTNWGNPNQNLASMESHADSLHKLGFDMCMFTDHDHRMAAEVPGKNPQPFLELEDMTQPTMRYTSQVVGNSAAAGAFQFTSTGLQITAKPASSGSQLVFASGDAGTWNYRANIANTTITLVLDTPARGQTAEFWMQLSHRPALNGRPEGSYTLRYQLSPDATLGSVTQTGLQGVLTIPVAESSTCTVVFKPEDDFAAAFPDLSDLSRDNGLYGIWFGVSSEIGDATATFRQLRIDRDVTLDGAIGLQQELMERLSSKYPSIHLAQGLELSYGVHVNWISGALQPGPQRPDGQKDMVNYLRSCVSMIRASGGAASFNHPFGALRGPLLTGTAYRAKIDKVAKQLLASGAYGCDILEVGYNIRGGVDLAAHLELWDIMLAAGYQIYANGTTDNHAGNLLSYQREGNQFATDIYSPSSDPAAATPGLIRGRSFTSLFTRFGGLLDLTADGASMGGVGYFSAQAPVPVRITVDGAPAASSVRAVQYKVHQNRSEYRRRTPIRKYGYSARNGSLSGTFNFNPDNSYIRFELINTGQVIAFSNPLFLRRA